MDPVSHAAVGAALACSAIPRSDVRVAAVAALAAVAPDVDILIHSDADPLLSLEAHRHFTHALTFAPVGALICAVLLYPIWRGQVTFGLSFLASLIGYASHGLLDACTSYGTLWLWPFSRERIAWDVISVVDPLFTVPLIAAGVYALVRHRPAIAVLGAAWGIAYLGCGLAQHQRALAAAKALAASRGHQATAVVVKPSFGNIVLWKSIYASDGRYYVDAVRLGLGARIFAGDSFAEIDPERDFPWLEPGSRQWRDFERFARFADGFVARDRGDRNRVVDMRYSLVPNRGDGLWGIELDPGAGTDAHAVYVTMRIRSAAEGRELLRMIFQGDSRR